LREKIWGAMFFVLLSMQGSCINLFRGCRVKLSSNGKCACLYFLERESAPIN
jgi:hypothetical protein